MKRLAIVVAVLSLAGSGAQAGAANQPKLRVLFVGNSLTYVNDLPAVVAGLGAASRLPDVEYRMLAPGGWSIEDHWTIGDAPKVLASGNLGRGRAAAGAVRAAGEPGEPPDMGDARRRRCAEARGAARALHRCGRSALASRSSRT